MSRSKQHKAVKNCIHNELKLTKDDIKGIVLEVAKEEVMKHITPELVASLVDTSVDTMLKQSLSNRGFYGDSFRENVTKLVAKEAAQFVRSQLQFDISVNGERADIDSKHTGSGAKMVIHEIS